jgi:inhibitor of KinA sporulation pathway (predicted exonuclease)
MITLQSEDYEILKIIRANSGRTMSSIINEVMSSMRPVLSQMAKSLEYIRKATDEKTNRLKDVLDEAIAELEPAAGQIDMFLAKMDEATREEDDDKSLKKRKPKTAKIKKTASDGR